jgi:para-aminobenzoate synthetase/4-amino-4-deoxychorismate lyase
MKVKFISANGQMHNHSSQPGLAIIHAPARGGWLYFTDPVHTLSAGRLTDVLPVMREVERLQTVDGLYAAGYLAYEAGPAFDPALVAKTPSGIPFVWFGLYREPQLWRSLPATTIEAKDTGLPGGLDGWTASISRPEYDGAIAGVKDHIANGHTYQVNYTFRLCAAFHGDPFQTFLWLARAQRAQYSAYIDTGRFTLCSASPELFFTLQGTTLSSRPMKGTAPRGMTLAEDNALADWLYHSEKNRAENVMIVDMVRNDIGRISRTGSVQVPELFTVEKYPTVWQMTSMVSGETNAGFTTIFQSLFPAASIIGAPKARTMRIIDELETTPRQAYCGAVGYSAPGREMQFNVAIRTLLVDRENRRAEYGIGGGITWDSVDESEYDECLTKAKILTAHLPQFDLLESLLWTSEDGYFLLEYHLARLQEAAAYFAYPLDLVETRRRLGDTSARLDTESYKVRLLVSTNGHISIEHQMLQINPAASQLRVGLAASPVNSNNPFLYHKTTHRQVYEHARISCPLQNDRPWDDVLLWNERGEITETTASNVLVERNGKLFTPPVACGLLGGTYRAWLLEQGLVQEQVILLEEVRQNPNIYLINSVRGKRPAKVIEFVSSQ